MVSSGFVPWYNRPPREYPIKRWLRARYPFTVSPAVIARVGSGAASTTAWQRREFPAKRWLRARLAAV